MNVLLIKPFGLSDHIQPSLGLGYLAAQIRPSHDVAIHDCIKEGTTLKQIPEVLERYRPDMVGMQCYTLDAANVKKFLKGIKEKDPKILTVVGGAHMSAIPQEAFERFLPHIDFGFRGEAEVGFLKFLDALEAGKKSFSDVEGLIWRDENGEAVYNAPALAEDLDSLGFPAWDLMPPETYPEAQHGAFFEKFPIAPIIVTRGCPYSCAFCSTPVISGKKLRKHSVKYIQDHIRLLYDRGVREFHIIDDNFTLDLNYCKQILRGIIDLNLDISLATPNGVRADCLDDEVLDLMKQAGQYLVTVAVESGTDASLKRMKKDTTVQKITEKIKLVKSHGFPVAGFFILGYPGESREDMLATIRLACKLGLIRANFFTYLPLPGTASYEELVITGEIKQVDWDNFYFMTAPYTPPGVSRQELLALKRKAFFSFYLNPRVFWANVRSVKSFRHFLFLSKRFYHWIIMEPSAPVTSATKEE